MRFRYFFQTPPPRLMIFTSPKRLRLPFYSEFFKSNFYFGCVTFHQLLLLPTSMEYFNLANLVFLFNFYTLFITFFPSHSFFFLLKENMKEKLIFNCSYEFTDSFFFLSMLLLLLYHFPK